MMKRKMARGPPVEGERESPTVPEIGEGEDIPCAQRHGFDRTKSAFANYCCGFFFTLLVFFHVAIELVRLEDSKIAPPRGKSRWLHHLTHESES